MTTVPIICNVVICSPSNNAANITYHYFVAPALTKDKLTGMADYTDDGAYLIHCNVGRDRTEFFYTLLQALCGADEDTMKATAA